MTKIKKQ